MVMMMVNIMLIVMLFLLRSSGQVVVSETVQFVSDASYIGSRPDFFIRRTCTSFNFSTTANSRNLVVAHINAGGLPS